ncbi:hypothetical protein CTA1_8647 [Colletotrichum tanaceti]|uniref:Uncharacterized protein n=1 Tax=Colletotrichum tanaceti TaxID=1306861 RepID=A0A4U6XSM5_9PEZI|nr:hypothetical protein CTA1_8647 [Colletotrichum tanaceti]
MAPPLLPPDFTPSLLRDAHDNLAGGRPLLELLVGLDGVLELKGRVDDGPDLALGHPRGDARQVVVGVLGEEDLELVPRAAEEGGQQQARHEAPGLGERDGAADELEVAAGQEEVVRGLVQVRRRVADVVDDDGEDVAAGAQVGDDVGRLVVDDVVGAEGAAQVGLGRGARDGDVAADGLCDLDAESAGAAGAAVDEDLVAGLDVGDDVLVGGEGGGAEGGGLLEVDRGGAGGGDGGDAVAVGDGVLAQRALGGHGVEAADDEVSRGDVGDGGADGDGAAGEVHAGAPGEGDDGLGDEAEVRELVVGRVDARGDDLDEDLVGLEGGGGGRRDGDEGEVPDEGAGGGDLPAAHLGGEILGHD